MRRRSEILPAAQVAALHERSTTWFYAHLPALLAAGHPRRDDLLGGWHRRAVQDWLDKRARETAGLPPPPTDPFLAALKDQDAA